MLNVKLKTILLFIAILISTNLHSKILDKDEARQADLSTLQEEISLFQSISLGISLSLAHCDNNENCSLPMEEKEIQQLLDTIESRIDSLAKRQTEIDDIIGFNKVLSAYISERDTYSEHLSKMKELIIRFGSNDESLQYGVDPDFPVEAAIDEDLLDYLSELTSFEDEELLDDEGIEESVTPAEADIPSQ